jgi:hypothetical protein
LKRDKERFDCSNSGLLQDYLMRSITWPFDWNSENRFIWILVIMLSSQIPCTFMLRWSLLIFMEK